MNWFKEHYGKDPMTKWVIGFLLVFLAIVVYLQPNWWPYIVGILVGFVALFYFMRKNP